MKAASVQVGLDMTSFDFGSRSIDETVLIKVVGRLRDIARFISLIRRQKPDLVHLNSSYDKKAVFRDVAYALACRIMSQRLFIKFHGTDSMLLRDAPFLYNVLTRIIFRYAARIGVLSSEELNNFVTAGFGEYKLKVVKNMVDLVDQSVSIRRNEEPPLLLFIGRFIPTKGLLDVIKALQLVHKAHVSAKLVCVGDGPDRIRAEKLVNELSLGEDVQFTGYINENMATEYYFRAALLVFPTYHEEGFPMVLFQSVAAGLPVITTKIRAAADYLNEPENCLWVEARNPELLSKKIVYLLRNPDVRHKMAANNKLLAAQFSAGEVVREYEELYQEILEE